VVGVSRSLEVERGNWPKSGLDFAEQLLQAMKLQSDSHLQLCYQQQQQPMTSTYFKELIGMISTLRELKQLKENHKIHVPLADFMQV
jgi:hypothetical protein